MAGAGPGPPKGGTCLTQGNCTARSRKKGSGQTMLKRKSHIVPRGSKTHKGPSHGVLLGTKAIARHDHARRGSSSRKEKAGETQHNARHKLHQRGRTHTKRQGVSKASSHH
eukprot:6487985-Amphidinium_carterae.4